MPFTKCITKIDGTTIDDAEDLDVVMPVYNLLEYSPNYSELLVSGFIQNMKELILMLIFNAFKSFKYKNKLLEKTEADVNNGVLGNATIQLLCF